MNILIPILLQILGALVIIVEFIVPSMGILTVIAIALTAYSLLLAFTTVSSSVGFTFVALDIILFPVIVFFGIKLLAASPATLKTTLKNIEKDTPDFENSKNLLGKEGKAITDLYPVGIALIEDTRVDVISTGNYIEKSAKIKVVSVNDNKIMVEKVIE